MIELNKIHNEDCMLGMKNIDDKSIDFICVDLPYMISRSSNFSKTSDKTPKQLKDKYNISIDFGDWDKIELDVNSLMVEYNRILKVGGSIVLFYDIWKMGQLQEVATMLNLKQHRIGCWLKTNPVPINSNVNYLSNAAEYFCCFTKGSKNTFNSKYDNGLYNYPICHGKERTEHPTQKPIKLIIDLIKTHTNDGDVVLDSHIGSGTTAIACLQTNRKFIGFELNKNYFDVAFKRLSSYIGIVKINDVFF